MLCREKEVLCSGSLAAAQDLVPWLHCDGRSLRKRKSDSPSLTEALTAPVSTLNQSPKVVTLHFWINAFTTVTHVARAQGKVLIDG